MHYLLPRDEARPIRPGPKRLSPPSRASTQAMERTMIRTNVSELTQGWHAAAACEPFDETMPPAWQEGWRLWHTRRRCQREAERHPQQSMCVH